MDHKNIAWQILARAEARGKNRNQVAADADINKRKLYLAIVGRQTFTLQMLADLADYFKCSVADLMADIPECYR